MLPKSPRLAYRPLLPRDGGLFLRLLRDPHVREYLLDGAIADEAFGAEAIAESEALVAEVGVGLWLAALREAGRKTAGFCGFRRFPGLGADPQLLYALLPGHTGRGLATEMGAACVAAAEAAGLGPPLHTAVDAPNRASARVLEKLGFRRVREVPGGPFGASWLFELGSRAGS